VPVARKSFDKLRLVLGVHRGLRHTDLHIDMPVDNLHRIGFDWNNDWGTHRLSAAYVETVLMKRAFHDAVDRNSARQVDMFMRAQILRGVELTLDTINGDGERADNQLLYVLVFKTRGIVGRSASPTHP
jgi:hypothetical protein